ncbi:hypothetical protein HKX48_007553 [Thoreauomyces humboldtii]|nr:hypothetical protein HKX48_007553 [Thoreauomyces humboldtii]
MFLAPPPPPTPAPHLHAWGEQHGGRFITPFYYTELDLISHARRTGLSDEEETAAIQRTTTTISRVARRLKLPGKTYAIASNLLHRFYAAWPRRNPHYTEEEMLVAVMDLACKLQETPIRLPQLAHHVLCEVRQEKITEEEAKSAMENRLAPHQQKLLESLQFDTNILHPFRSLATFIKQLDGVRFRPPTPFDPESSRQELYRLCSAVVLDSYRCTVCVQFPPHIIAVAVLSLAEQLWDLRVFPPIEGQLLQDFACPANLVDGRLEVALNRTAPSAIHYARSTT